MHRDLGNVYPGVYQSLIEAAFVWHLEVTSMGGPHTASVQIYQLAKMKRTDSIKCWHGFGAIGMLTRH